MSVFTDSEIDYLNGQRLGRLATVGPDGGPHVVPVGFRYNPEEDTIDIGGHGFAKSKKFRDVQHEPRVAFVVDNVESINPWKVRGVEIRGRAELSLTDGTTIRPNFDPEMIRIRPERVVSWGMD
jgi:pyridoxamine 5'-phosphate oxidase family protein